LMARMRNRAWMKSSARRRRRRREAVAAERQELPDIDTRALVTRSGGVWFVRRALVAGCRSRGVAARLPGSDKLLSQHGTVQSDSQTPQRARREMVSSRI